MAETNYGNYFTTGCVKPNTEAIGAVSSTRHLENTTDRDITVDAVLITKAQDMITQPHTHEFPQYLHFFSANLYDSSDFDAEIEVCLGEELEKHIVTEPTALHIPAGLSHGPIKLTKVNKPVLFLDIAVTTKYTRVGDTPD